MLVTWPKNHMLLIFRFFSRSNRGVVSNPPPTYNPHKCWPVKYRTAHKMQTRSRDLNILIRWCHVINYLETDQVSSLMSCLNYREKFAFYHYWNITVIVIWDNASARPAYASMLSQLAFCREYVALTSLVFRSEMCQPMRMYMFCFYFVGQGG